MTSVKHQKPGGKNQQFSARPTTKPRISNGKTLKETQFNTKAIMVDGHFVWIDGFDNDASEIKNKKKKQKNKEINCVMKTKLNALKNGTVKWQCDMIRHDTRSL